MAHINFHCSYMKKDMYSTARSLHRSKAKPQFSSGFPTSGETRRAASTAGLAINQHSFETIFRIRSSVNHTDFVSI
uniref:Uncharacterized protein n=1 Tax=Arundo donax TaxID=35708 RepID=A0A0A9GHN2_ARUDO